jgi:hypothetical protein
MINMKKYAVKRTPYNFKEVNDFFSSITNCKFTNGGISTFNDGGIIKRQEFNYLHYPAVKNSMGGESYFKRFLIQGYEEITLEEFKKIYGNMQKKIIGYKVPYNMFRNNIQKDVVYVKSNNPDYYVPEGAFSVYSLPKEIVESWEPVYEEECKSLYYIGCGKSLYFIKGFFGTDINKIDKPIVVLKNLIDYTKKFNFGSIPSFDATVDSLLIDGFGTISKSSLLDAYKFYTETYKEC